MDQATIREAFLLEVRSRSGSEASHRQYRGILRRFHATNPDPRAVAPADVHAFVFGVGPTGRIPGPACIALRLSALRSWYEFLGRMEVVDRNPALRVKRPKIPRRPFASLSTGEIIAFFRAFPDPADVPMTPMYRAAALAILYTGVRRSALIGLRSGDLRFSNCAWRFRAREKGNIEIDEEMPPPVMQAIADAARAIGRPLESLKPEDKVFPFAGNTLLGWVRRAGTRAGLGRVHCHRLRHQAAHLQYLHGATIEELQHFLHQADLKVTSHYVKAVLTPKRPTRWREISADIRLDNAG